MTKMTNTMPETGPTGGAGDSGAAPTEPMFRFKGRATGRDPEGYYYVRWDRAQPISVVARSKVEADKKAWALLGAHPRFGTWRGGDGSGWTLVWDSIDEELPGG